ncbi:synaptotagmin-14-like [Menidia menidia]
MAFFKSFQQTLPSVKISSILDSVTSRVDDLATAVSDVTYAVSDQLTEQVTTIINKVQEEGDGENGGHQEPGQAPEAGSKGMWQMPRDLDAGHTGSKNNQASDSTEGENSQSQLEWEWRDGCWRVKKTEAELAEEERRKKEEKEQEERREQRRKERREKQLEKEAKAQRDQEEFKKEEQKEVIEDSETTDTKDGRDRKENESSDQLAAQPKSAGCDKLALSPSCEADAGISKPKELEDGEEVGGPEREADNEEEAELSRSSTAKKKKSDKKKRKGSKESPKKSENTSDVEKKQDTSKKSKKKKKKKKKTQDGNVSDSEEEEKGPEASTQQNSTSGWSSKNKESSELGGYSSEASSEQTSSIQRIKKDPSLSELQPPPYQDERSGPRASSRARPERGARRPSSPPRCDSEASGEQDSESYLNKGGEEDIPSDSTAVLGPEDGSRLQLPAAYEPEPLAKYGTLDVAFEYDSGEQWLAVTVTAATDIPALKQTGNISWQVHVVLLPTKKQRAKTGVQRGPCPVFTETFKFSRVEQEALGDCAVRFRLYSIRRMKKEKVLGEKVFHLTKLNLQGKIALPVTLEPGSELTGCGSLVSVSRSAGALSYRSTEDSSLPEILLGLIYNSATGQLSAEVIQGSHFKTTASDKPINGLFCCVKHFVRGQLYIIRDTYVKLTMLDSKGKEMSKRKTAVCRGQPNPTYKETFVFQVALFQLSEVSLVLSAFCRRSSMRPRERLGWVSLGHSSTSEDQQAHWTEMREAEGQQVCHWHTLTDT